MHLKKKKIFNRDVNNDIMELLIVAYAAKTSSARNIVGVIPYLPYSRQCKMRKRGSIVCKLLATMISRAGEWGKEGVNGGEGGVKRKWRGGGGRDRGKSGGGKEWGVDVVVGGRMGAGGAECKGKERGHGGGGGGGGG